LEEWCGKPFECLRKSLEAEPLEVFHYHKAIIPTNYKLWHDTNSEFYHDFMHYHNRVTGFNDAYFARKNEAFAHGHVVVGTFEVNYDKYEGFESRAALSFPHLPPNQWYMIDLFPGMNFNLRGSALRCDVVTPLGPDKVMIEFRGLGLKRDTEEERQTHQPSQLDLGPVRPQPARGPARRHRPGHSHVAGLGATPHPARPPREPDHSRREWDAPLLQRMGQVDEPAAERSGTAVPGPAARRRCGVTGIAAEAGGRMRK
jgi:methanesulfonate monooxygenase large subunit